MVQVSSEKDDRRVKSSINEKYVPQKVEVKSSERRESSGVRRKEDIKKLKERKQQTKNQDVLYIFGICFLLGSFYQIKGSIVVIDL